MTEKLDLDNFKDKYKNLTEGESALVEAILTLSKQIGVIAGRI